MSAVSGIDLGRETDWIGLVRVLPCNVHGDSRGDEMSDVSCIFLRQPRASRLLTSAPSRRGQRRVGRRRHDEAALAAEVTGGHGVGGREGEVVRGAHVLGGRAVDGAVPLEQLAPDAPLSPLPAPNVLADPRELLLLQEVLL